MAKLHLSLRNIMVLEDVVHSLLAYCLVPVVCLQSPVLRLDYLPTFHDPCDGSDNVSPPEYEARRRGDSNCCHGAY